ALSGVDIPVFGINDVQRGGIVVHSHDAKIDSLCRRIFGNRHTIVVENADMGAVRAAVVKLEIVGVSVYPDHDTIFVGSAHEAISLKGGLLLFGSDVGPHESAFFMHGKRRGLHAFAETAVVWMVGHFMYGTVDAE